MKIDNSDANVPDLNQGKPSRPEKQGAARFQTLLARSQDKHGDKAQDSLFARKKLRSGLQDDAEDPAKQPAFPFDPSRLPAFRPPDIDPVQASRPVAPSAIVEGLVREITVVSSGERQDVQIQFDSRTLDGLQIRISKEAGNVSIQFITSSSEVEKVLQRNMEQLTQNLNQRGIQLTSNRIERTAETAAPRPSQRQGGRQGRPR